MPEQSELLSISLMVAVVAILALAGMYTAAAIRRWSQREHSVEAFSLDDLRNMRAQGEITEAEFKAMRDALLAEMAATMGDIPAPTADATASEADEGRDSTPDDAPDAPTA